MRHWPTLLSLLACGLSATWVSAASAQNQRQGVFSVQRFKPAPGPRNGLAVRGVRTDGEMAYSIGALANYANEPFVVASCTPGTGDCPDGERTDVRVIENLVTGDLMGSLTPFPKLQVGLRLPLVFAEGDGLTEEGQPDFEGGFLSVFGLGDPELELKVRALGELRDPLTAGVALTTSAPLGNAMNRGSYVGDRSVGVGLHALADYSENGMNGLFNLGFATRPKGRVGETTIGNELRYGAHFGFEASQIVSLVAELNGASGLSSDDGANALEGDGAIRIGSGTFLVTLGAGAGIVKGIGSPKLRAFAGFLYVAEVNDRDGDGISDSKDQCPVAAEDVDGFEDSDGCPDPDDDGDGVPDVRDKCRADAEDLDGFEDEDGCPELDNDEDGVRDERDRCADEPETINGYQDEDGCPDVPDTDGDGVNDKDDKCPSEPEDTDGFDDTDGCPDPDNDGDGINDDVDDCVDEPETKNGRKDKDGCPD